MDLPLTFRLAAKDDLFDIVQMLADDSLGATREIISDTVSEQYISAFENIIRDLTRN
jgi:hypothetical protein